MVVSAPLIIGLARAQETPPPTAPDAKISAPKMDPEIQKEVEECMGCHSAAAETGPVVQINHLLQSPHAAFGCKACHSSITDAPHTPEMLKEKAACGDCHTTESEQYFKSIHASKDKVPGDHPKCVTCHAGGDPHSVKLFNTWTRAEKVGVCSNCHRDKDRMARYGPNTEAVSSYEHSFHGRALLKFGSQKTAICIDCHSAHAAHNPKDPAAMTAPGHIEATCGKCHKGAGPNFSVSGANHMDLTIHRQPILSAVLLFFKVLVSGMASFLLFGVVLDLRRSVFGKTPPRCGRLIGTVVSLGFLGLVAAIAQATFGLPGGMISTVFGVSMLLLSMLINAIQRKRNPEPVEPGPDHDRFHPSIRVQHMVLMISFTLLILTGMPVRNPNTETLRTMYLSIGGLEVGRIVHRTAGVALISVFLFHVAELIWKWKKAGFRWSAWTMLPSKQDVQDFVQETTGYLGMHDEIPKYGRFHFREKLDYFAEYWGIPLMAITGLILWFPVFFGNFLPPIAVPIAFIAHSYEAVLAFIAILTWHLYNSYFNPNHFATSPPWRVGILSEEDMRHKHPLELEKRLAEKAPEPEPEG